ncbi:MAG: zinc-binding dehydrogenase [Candidatus Poribacteria bacterium]|nr:zinc-binding dehydrogenase [Candidatus Poribacteria bacterium]
MKRVAKPEGKFNIVIEDVPVPEPGPSEVRVKAVRSLISRGSEIGARYTREYAIDPERVGYSLAGVVDAVGAEIDHLAVGDRVVASAPHAEYVVRPARVGSPHEQAQIVPMLPSVSFDQAPYYPLVSGAVSWVEIENIQPNDTVVIIGQGLVGSLIMQVAKANGNGRIIAVDALDSRCRLAEELGADVVINAADEDAVRAVQKLTNGIGADIVVYAVGGPAGPKAFDQALDMLAVGGLLHLIGLYEDAPLPLWSGKIQRRRLLGGYYGQTVGASASRRAMELLGSGVIQTEKMTTHRFPYTQAAEAFDLLYNRLNEAMGVLLDWER